MHYLKQTLGLVFSRQMLACVAMAALALAVWFVGPALALDGMRPLDSAGVRITLVVLLLVLGLLWLASGPISLVGIAALCLLIWHAGPSLALGSMQPLASFGVRALVVGLIVLACVLYWLYRLLAAMRANENFLDRLLDFGKADIGGESAREELKDVGRTVGRAMTQLKRLRAGGGTLQRAFEGKRYLYELPWYLIVGSAGAGKTTALLNAGLQFPTARRMGGLPRGTVLGADGGTLHCDWWFTNEAVLIDTAGRYTTHDSHVAKDPVEWKGFLALLRKHRTRAPLNGVIVALDVAEILGMTASQRFAHAATVRDRLAELRHGLGIRFPVYVIVTKMDLLRGFSAYFQSLTSEGRAQPWGFTLPYQARTERDASDPADATGRRPGLGDTVRGELVMLRDRLAAGLRLRVNEEFDVDRRRLLFALPQEFAGLSAPLARFVEEIFVDSRFDGTQRGAALRGIYFTSGAQADVELPADRETLAQRLMRCLRADVGPADTRPKAEGHGFFLHDVMTRVIIPEAHLVRPNLRWELRFRLLRLAGHALAIGVFVWLAGAVIQSFGNNHDYLRAAGQRADALAEQLRDLFAVHDPSGMPDAKAVPDVLNAAWALPAHAGLDLESPPASFQYGLYAAPPVLDAARTAYAHLRAHTLLPPILRRMERVLAQSLDAADAERAYETLRVYKLLHDAPRYMKDGGARDVRNWVLADWRNRREGADRTDRSATEDARSVQADAMARSASMALHLDALFSGDRPVQSVSLPNAALVRDVQRFLDTHTSTRRVYERARVAMLPEAPQDFTLVRAVGPQVGTVFARAGGLPLERGVPGLFTYDGYHGLFARRLPEFVRGALDDDAWVMGRDPMPPKVDAGAGPHPDPLLDDIRRQYLIEYTQHWEAFLDSIRTVGGGAGGAGGAGIAGEPVAGRPLGAAMTASGAPMGLGFDLSVLRQLAAPDSPLARLARAAARETTLSRPLVAMPQEDKGLLGKARDPDRQGSRQTNERLEKEIVDNRFAALREVVMGQPDMGTAGAGGGVGSGAASGGRPGLEAVSALVNEFYTLLVVADTALTAGTLPPGGAEVGTRLALEAGKLPTPFRAVLIELAASGGAKVTHGATDILRKQAQMQVDRLMGLMATQVSEPCKRGIEGRYPLAAVAQDASIEDFTLVFAAGGALDEFFARYLAPFVDTGVRPWRYKSPESARAMVGIESIAAGTAPVAVPTGPTLLGELLKLLAQAGPNLDAFYRAQQIREVFFRDAGGRKLAWKMDLKVLELEPAITDLVIDIDGQGQRYVHGPVLPFSVGWPGPRGGAMAELTANPRVSGATSTLLATGPWALFRLLDKGRILDTATPGRLTVEYLFDGRRALLDVGTGSQANPLNSGVLRDFRCPGRAA